MEQAVRQPWDAYAALAKDLSMINWVWRTIQMGVGATMKYWPTRGAQVFAGVRDSLESWVRKLHDAVEAVAKALPGVLNVTGFSVGIGSFPLSFSASISFSLGDRST